MNEVNIVPFASPAAKVANDGDNPIKAIEDLLRALEGLQAQVQTLTEIVCEQDKRIEKLERKKIIRVMA